MSVHNYKILALISSALLLQSCTSGQSAFQNTPMSSTDSSIPVVSTLGDSMTNGASNTQSTNTTSTTGTSSNSSNPAPDPAHPGTQSPPVGTGDIYGGVEPIAETEPLGLAPAASNIHNPNMPYNPQPVNPYAQLAPYYNPNYTPDTLPDGNITKPRQHAPNVDVDPLLFAPKHDPLNTDQIYCDSKSDPITGDTADDAWSCISHLNETPQFGVAVPTYEAPSQLGTLNPLSSENPLPPVASGTSLAALFERAKAKPMPTFVTSAEPVAWWVNYILNQDADQLMNYVSDTVKVLEVTQNPDYASDVKLLDNDRFSISYWKKAAPSSSQDNVEVNSQLRSNIPSHHADWVLHKMMYRGPVDPANGFLGKHGKVHIVVEQENAYNHIVPFSEIISSPIIIDMVQHKGYRILSTSNGIVADLSAFRDFYDHTHGISKSHGEADQAFAGIKAIFSNDRDGWNLSNPYPTGSAIYLGHLVVPSDVVQDKNKNIYQQVPMLNTLNYLAQHNDLSYISPTADSQNGQINLLEGLLYAYPDQWTALRKSIIVVGAINNNPSGQPHGFSNTCALSSRYCVLAYPFVHFKSVSVNIGGKTYFQDVDKNAVFRNPGVSFSTPYVVSEVALIRSVFPFFTNYNVQTTVLTTAQQLAFEGKNAGYPFNLNTGWGAVRPDIAVSGPKMFYFRDFVADFSHQGTDLTSLPQGHVYTFANDISGHYGLQVIGNDTKNVLNLAGNDSYEGPTLLRSNAIVNVDGRLTASNVTVEHTAALYGQGEVQSVSSDGDVHAYRYDINAENTNEYKLRQQSLAFALKYANGDADTIHAAAMLNCGQDIVLQRGEYDNPDTSAYTYDKNGKQCGGLYSDSVQNISQTSWHLPTTLDENRRTDEFTANFDYTKDAPQATQSGEDHLPLALGLLVNGDYLQTENGTLYARLDQPLAVTGTATLAGNLAIDGVAPMLMPTGQPITAVVLISKKAIKGAFSSVKSVNNQIALEADKAYSVTLTASGTHYYGVAVRASYRSSMEVNSRSANPRALMLGARNADAIHDTLFEASQASRTSADQNALRNSRLYQLALQLQSANQADRTLIETQLQATRYTRYLDETQGETLAENSRAQWALFERSPKPFELTGRASADWGDAVHVYRERVQAAYHQDQWRVQLGFEHVNQQLSSRPQAAKNQRWGLDFGAHYALSHVNLSAQLQAQILQQQWDAQVIGTQPKTVQYRFDQKTVMGSLAIDKAFPFVDGSLLHPYLGLELSYQHLEKGRVQGSTQASTPLYIQLPTQSRLSSYATLGVQWQMTHIHALPLTLTVNYGMSVPLGDVDHYAAQLQDQHGQRVSLWFKAPHRAAQQLATALSYQYGTWSLGLETHLRYQYQWIAGLSLQAAMQF